MRRVALGLLLAAADAIAAPPTLLSETGLYADAVTKTVAADVRAFTPQYPLWTDGASKQRWIALPVGTAIDATDPDRWVFPVGTRVWKEFAYGRRVETRFMELGSDGRWSMAAYVWNDDGTDALLAPERGTRVAVEGGAHDVPGRWDCVACHGTGGRVLGFSALQLSTDRDRIAPHATPEAEGDLDLATLIREGLITGVDDPAPRIAAATDRERAVLGYLHTNCGTCHDGNGVLSTKPFRFDQQAVEALDPRTLVAAGLVTPGDPAASEILRRMGSREAAVQMPPLGTRRVDDEAVALIEAWIREDLSTPTSPTGAEAPDEEISR